MSDTANYGYGQLTPEDIASDHNALVFVIQQILARFRTVGIVQVQSFAPGIGFGYGTVTCQQMVNMIDGIGNATPHGPVYNMPYIRVQGGANAVLCDPVALDIGLALICDRDISSVVATQQISNPGSTRIANLADGVYLGGLLNGIPENIIGFDALGNILLTSLTGAVKITAPLGLFVNGTPVTVP
jgi:hypothetical protein